MNNVDVAGLIFQLIALAIPVIFIVILSFYWKSPKKTKQPFSPTEQKIISMENKLKKWMDDRK